MKNKPLLPFVFRHWENSVGSYLMVFSKILKWRSGFHEVFFKYFTKCWSNHYFPFLKRDYLTRFFFVGEGWNSYFGNCCPPFPIPPEPNGCKKRRWWMVVCFFLFRQNCTKSKGSFLIQPSAFYFTTNFQSGLPSLIALLFLFLYLQFHPPHPTPCHYVLFW